MENSGNLKRLVDMEKDRWFKETKKIDVKRRIEKENIDDVKRQRIME